MRTRRTNRLLTLIAAVSLFMGAGLAWSTTVHAQGNTPQIAMPVRLRLCLVVGLGVLSGTTDSKYPTTPERPKGIWPQAGLGVMWSPYRHAGVGLLGRTVFSPMELGRTRLMAEVLAFPHVHELLPHSARSRIYFGLPVGVVWPSQHQEWRRAVQEDWRGHAGLSVGTAIGIELWGPRSSWGGLIEIGYQTRFYSADLTSTLADTPQAQVKDRVAYQDIQLLLWFGLLWGLL